MVHMCDTHFMCVSHAQSRFKHVWYQSKYAHGCKMQKLTKKYACIKECKHAHSAMHLHCICHGISFYYRWFINTYNLNKYVKYSCW